MRTKMFVAAIAALVVALGIWTSLAPGQAGKGAAAAPAAAAQQFAGKVIAVSSAMGDPEYIIAMEKVELRHIAENAYLVGKGVGDTRGELWKGQTVWVALDDISEITEFPDVESYKKAGPKAATK